MKALMIRALAEIPEVSAGAELGRLIVDAAARSEISVEPPNVIAVAQKIVSKAEGRLV